MSGFSDRPVFPKRAVVTSGMPYGNKSLHFGHVGGVFVQADVLARFLRDRIGSDNVVFVSGTDCYGSPIAEGYRKQVEAGAFSGTIEDYVMANHLAQKETLDRYGISLDLFGASGLGETKKFHAAETDAIMTRLYENGYLKKITNKQFYDAKVGTFLNGRQVIGRCPVQGCKSEKGYADECDLGHQYMPDQLIAPKSTLTGETPEMRDVTNWYFDLKAFDGYMKEYVKNIRKDETVRSVVADTISEFLVDPVIYVKSELYEEYAKVKDGMPAHRYTDDGKSSFVLGFDKLEERDKACKILASAGIRYREGKTTVPFRLTGNIEWGVPAPALDGTAEGLTVWVWPESLWAPISFTKAYLASIGKDENEWKKYWCSKEARVYQIMGQDNIYFYGNAQTALWLGTQKGEIQVDPPEGDLQLSTLVADHHVLFLDKKASSSGNIKPPMAAELLDHYTAEQLRAHFIALGLGLKSVSFRPKMYDPRANERDADPVIKEGNLFCNVLNRLARSCFYTSQKYFDSTIPVATVSDEVKKAADDAILAYEQAMYRTEFHTVMTILDEYIRGCNKYWAKNMTEADKNDDNDLRRQTLVDAFHMLRVCTVLSHPIVPTGCEMLREYLGFDESFWSWEHVFETVYFFMEADHKLKFLEPRVDFFARHESQLN